MDKKPLHVFIIPDGNRRWAKENQLPISIGYARAYKVFEHLSKKIWSLGITHFTAWGLSKDNLINRPKEEIFVLNEIIEMAISNLLISPEVEEEKVRVRVVGRWDKSFFNPLKEKIKALENKTAHYGTDKNLTLLLAYNGDDEIRDALWRFKNNPLRRQNPSLEDLRRWSWSWFLPDVDIFIRTGFEPHLSNGALMLHMADSHLYFPAKNWPDFTIDDLKEIISDFKNRQRRFGA